MNPIIRSVDTVKYRIPKQILDEVFQKKNYRWRDTPISIDEQIINQVIKPRVLVDCNLVGGTEALISLEGLPGEFVENFQTVYRIPKDRTQGRSIMSVLSVGYGSASLIAHSGGNAAYNSRSATPITMAGQAMMDAMSPTPIVSTAKVSLIGENVILVKDTSPPVANAFIRCVLANDENLSHIQLRSIPAFCKLVEYAVKSYIYNELTILIGQAQLSGGQELGRFKDIVDSYADAEQMYSDYLKDKWQKIAMMNDEMSMTRFVKMQIGTQH